MEAAIKNPKSGEIKTIKIGWSWTLFLLSGFFGLPLFLRRLYAWGALLLTLWIVQIAVPPLLSVADQLGLYIVLTILFLGIQIFLGLKGNEMTAKNYLERDWIFVDDTSQATRIAKQTWKLSSPTASAMSVPLGAQSAAEVPQGNSSRNRKNTVPWLLIPTVCIVVAGAFWLVRSGHLPDAASGTTKSSVPAFHIGDTFKTDKFSIKVQSAQLASIVGQEPFTSEAPHGAEYVAIQWVYKNISKKPISVFDTPSIKLVSPDGTVYDTDAGASGSYATQVKDDTKVLSDLNPGIRSTSADVFEVSRNLFNPDTWRILIKADRDFVVAFDRAPPVESSPKPTLDAAAESPRTTETFSNSAASARHDAGLIPVMGADTTGVPASGSATVAAAAVTESPHESPQPATVSEVRAPSQPADIALPSFDCAKAMSAVERAICTNADLAKADSELANFYKQNVMAANATNIAGVADLKASQRAFIAERNKCTTVDCMLEAYRSRYEAIAQMGFVKQ